MTDLPHSIDAEQAILGGLLLAPDSFPRVADLLTEADFYRRDHALLWRAIRQSEKDGLPYDAVTLAAWFESRGEEDPLIYLVDLARNTPSAANVEAYAAIVADKAHKRRLIQVGTDTATAAYANDGRSAEELQTAAMQALTGTGQTSTRQLKTVTDGLAEMVDLITQRLRTGGMIGTSFGLADMDAMTGGKQPGDLIIIAGRPSMGKTTLAMQGCFAAGRPLIFSFETMAERLLARLTAHAGRLPLNWILSPQTAPDLAFEKITAAAQIVKDRMRASIHDGRRLKWEQLRAIALREHDRDPVSEVVVDHFGHLLRDGRGRADQEQGEDMKNAKALAREMGVPVVMLMQLNRGVESRVDKRPMLSDLRECGAAEEDADIVAMLYRDGYYNPAPDNPLKDFAEIFLRKNRDGYPGDIWTKPCLPEMRFDSAEPQTRPHSNPSRTDGNGGATSGIPARGQSGAVCTIRGDH